MYSDWFAISQNSSRNSARTCRNARNDKGTASFIVPVGLVVSGEGGKSNDKKKSQIGLYVYQSGRKLRVGTFLKKIT